VTGWAIENLPPGPLRSFFSEPAVFNAALYGAAFPDSGYWVDTGPTREYAEYAHWEPFIESFIQLIRSEHPPGFWSPEERKLVAFMMGCAAHGLQDEIFDSTFLFQVAEHDGKGQSEADGGTDFLLIDEGHQRFLPERFLPMDTLLRLYAERPEAITQETILSGVDTQESTYVNDGLGLQIARSLAPASRDLIPWTAQHYLDPEVPGILYTEITPTMQYLQAVWDRLHGRWKSGRDPVVHVFPDDGRALRSASAGTVDGWVTMILGKGIAIDSAAGTLLGAHGTTVDARFTGTRWGHPFPRVVRFQPSVDLEPGRRYTAVLHAGAEMIDRGGTTGPHRATVRAACDDRAHGCPGGRSSEGPKIDGSARHAAQRRCVARSPGGARCPGPVPLR